MLSNNLHTAPNASAFTPGDYDGSMRHDSGPPEEKPMSTIQIAMAREIGGWPLYTIIIAAGQVSALSVTLLRASNIRMADAQRD